MAFLSDEKVSRSLPDYERQGIKQVNFDNRGSVIALAGNDFCIIAADNWLHTGYSIYTRKQYKLFPLSDTMVLGCSGCWCDILRFTRLLADCTWMCKHEHLKDISTPVTAQMLSMILRYTKFCPYYVNNVLAGLDENGKGCVYSHNLIGHCERSTYRAGGSAGALLQSLLDNQIGYKNQEGVEPEPLTQEKALLVLKDVFISAAERDISIGGGISIKVITKKGIESSSFPLKRG